MSYTVKKLAEISGVSVRALHFYDEIGLLKPAYVGENNYRYYEEDQLLMLQQILFYRELGFELKEIQSILKQSDFDKVKALKSHQSTLVKKRGRFEQLLKTIDKTIRKLTGVKNMADQEMYKGFSPEKEAELEAYLVNRYGDGAKEAIEETKRNTKDWTEADHEKYRLDMLDVCAEIGVLLDAGQTPDSKKVQDVVVKHYALIKKCWTPDKDAYVALANEYVGLAWKEAFEHIDDNHPRLAKFLAEAMMVYASRQLQ